METMKKQLKSKKQKNSETEKTKSDDDRSLESTQDSPLSSVAEEKTQNPDCSLQDSSNLNPSAEQKNEYRDPNIATKDIPKSEFHPITPVPLTPDIILDTLEIFHTPDSLVSNVQNVETNNSMSNIPEEELRSREEMTTPNTRSTDNQVYMTAEVDTPSSNPNQKFASLGVFSTRSQEIPTEHSQSKESTMDATGSEHVENEGAILPLQVIESEIKDIPFKVKRIEDVLKDFNPLNIVARKNPELSQENKAEALRRDDNIQKLDELKNTTKHQEMKEPSNVNLIYAEAKEKKVIRDIGIETDMVFIARPLCILDHLEETSSMKSKSEILKEAEVTLTSEKDQVPDESSCNQEQGTLAQPETDATETSKQDEQSNETARRQKPPVHVMRFSDAFNSMLDKIMAMRYSAYKANNQLKWLQRAFPPIMKEILMNLSINDSNDENDERKISTDLKSRKNKIFHLSDLEEDISSLVECVNKNQPKKARDMIQRIRIALNKFYLETIYLLKDCKYVLKNHDSMLQYNARENLLRIRIKTDFKLVSDQLKKSIEEYILARERFIVCSNKYLHKQLGLNVLDDIDDTLSRPSSKRKTMPITVNRFRRALASIRNAFKEVIYRIDRRF